jgi:regulator of sirC expression with transglutaminase-like and TPR domain
VQGTANFLPAPLSDDTGVAETPATIPANEAVATDATPPPVDDNELKRLLDQSLQAFQNEKWQALIELSNNILAIDPTVTTALTNRAAAYTELGSFGDALADCNRAIKLEPKNPLAINNRGYVYEKMGDYQNATVDYEKACALGVEISCKEAQRLKSRKPEKL